MYKGDTVEYHQTMNTRMLFHPVTECHHCQLWDIRGGTQK